MLHHAGAVAARPLLPCANAAHAQTRSSGQYVARKEEEMLNAMMHGNLIFG